MAHFAGIGLGSTLAPGIIWARMQDAGEKKITLAMVADAMKLSGLEFTEDELKAMVDAANQNLTRFEEMRAMHIPNDVSPPFHFSAIVPGIDGEQDEAALPTEHGAGGEAPGEPRGRRVLAGAPSRANWCARSR